LACDPRAPSSLVTDRFEIDEHTTVREMAPSSSQGASAAHERMPNRDAIRRLAELEVDEQLGELIWVVRQRVDTAARL